MRAFVDVIISCDCSAPDGCFLGARDPRPRGSGSSEHSRGEKGKG